MHLKKNDIVLILFNNTIGRVERIHTAADVLHDVRGLDGYMYGNQLIGELEFIGSLDESTLKTLTSWIAEEKHDSNHPNQ